MSSRLIKKVEKPARYIGKELNSVIKKNVKAKFLLAFPDTYEIGMSHFGSRILYESINYHSPYAMERVYMPWKDMYNLMKEHTVKLKSLESESEMKDFDAVGFSSSSELAFTNIIAMIELGGLEAYKSKRKDTDPLVILGGIASYNPAPLKDFIDVFVIGEADILIQKILEVLAATKNKKERLFELAKLEGVYIPELDENKIVKKIFLSSLDESYLIKKPLIPISDLIHNRITYEIQRGCVRGCRFCQAGMIYRPTRQRSMDEICNSIDEDIKLTGYRDIGFLSLNACDYAPLLKVVNFIYENYKNLGVSVSLPSLRIESISEDFLKVLAKLPKGGFTIAPEAGSEKLRKIINKDISETETIDTVKLVSKLGWNSIKTYFMVGLPGEDVSDLESIVELAHKMLYNLREQRQNITVSISNFIPKPHTPFQWCKQDSYLETEEKINYFMKKLKNKRIKLKWTDSKISEIEGLLSRADEKLSPVLYELYKKGEIFSSWGSIDFNLWHDTLKKYSLDINDYLNPGTKKLAWDNIDSGVSIKFLEAEYEKSKTGILTSSCIKDSCSNCGVCSKDTKNDIAIVSEPKVLISYNEAETDKLESKYRFRFLKLDLLKYISHFELMSFIEKASIRAKLPVMVTTGFNPGLKISYSPPVSYAVASKCELADFYFYKKVDPIAFIEAINKELPKELCFLEYFDLLANTRSISSGAEELTYNVSFNEAEYLINENIKNYFNIESDSFYPKNVKVKVLRKAIEKELILSDYLEKVQKLDKLNFRIILKYKDDKCMKVSEILKLLFKTSNDYEVTKESIRVNGIHYGDKQQAF